MIILCKILIIIALTGIIKIAGRESFNILFYLGVLIHGLRNMLIIRALPPPLFWLPSSLIVLTIWQLGKNNLASFGLRGIVSTKFRSLD